MMTSTFTTLVVAVVLVVTTVQGFAPASQGGRAGTQLQKSIFDAISDMDLWAPDKDANTYGARNKKKVSLFNCYLTFFLRQLLRLIDTKHSPNIMMGLFFPF